MKFANNLISPASKSVAARGYSLVAGILMSLVITRNLNTEQAGLFFLIYASVYVLAALGRFGADNINLKHGSSPNQNDRTLIQSANRLSLLLSFALAFLVGMTACIFFPHLYGLNPLLLISISSCIPGINLAINSGSLFRSNGKMIAGALAELGLVPTLICAITQVYKCFSKVNIDEMLLFLVLSIWITGLWASIRAKNSHNKFNKGNVHDARQSGDTKLNYWIMASTTISTFVFLLLAWAPIFILSITNQQSYIAYFSVAIRFANLVLLYSVFQNSHLGPVFAESIRGKNISDVNLISSRAVIKSLYIGIPIGFFLEVSSAFVIPQIYGDSYRFAVPILMMLVIGNVITLFFGQVTQLLLLSNLEHASSLLAIVTSLIWLVFGIPVSILFGPFFVSLVSIVASTFYAISGSHLLNKLKGIKTYLTFRSV